MDKDLVVMDMLIDLMVSLDANSLIFALFKDVDFEIMVLKDGVMVP